jgi:hypothetical protein
MELPQDLLLWQRIHIPVRSTIRNILKVVDTLANMALRARPLLSSHIEYPFI